MLRIAKVISIARLTVQINHGMVTGAFCIQVVMGNQKVTGMYALQTMTSLWKLRMMIGQHHLVVSAYEMNRYWKDSLDKLQRKG